MKAVAVLGCVLQVESPSSGVANITSTPDNDVSVDGKNAYFGTINISVSGASTTGATGGSGTGTLTGTSKNCTNHGKPAILEGDTCTISVTGTSTVYPYPSVTWPLIVKISNASQTSFSVD